MCIHDILLIFWHFKNELGMDLFRLLSALLEESVSNFLQLILVNIRFDSINEILPYLQVLARFIFVMFMSGTFIPI